jgi:hypothetical protein
MKYWVSYCCIEGIVTPVLVFSLRDPRTPRPAGHPVIVGPPSGERGKRAVRGHAPVVHRLRDCFAKGAAVWALACLAHEHTDPAGDISPGSLDQMILRNQMPPGRCLKVSGRYCFTTELCIRQT